MAWYRGKQQKGDKNGRNAAKRMVLLAAVLALGVSFASKAQGEVGQKYSNKGYELTVYYQPQVAVSESLLVSIQELYFGSYPAMRETYGTTEGRSVEIYLTEEPQETVSYTSGDKIYCSRQFLEESDGNKNVLIHELFHVVQNGYPGLGEEPAISVFCEGLADYIRAEYGFYPEEDWSLPAYDEGQSYLDSYRVTAAFLSWAADTCDPTLPIRLNRVLHEGSYTDQFWADATGYGLDELWEMYASGSGTG